MIPPQEESAYYDLTIKGITEPVSFSGYETHEYDVNNRLVRTKYYSNEEVTIMGKVYVEAGLTGYTIIEYDSKSSKILQFLGLKNIALDVAMDGQVVIQPATGAFAVSKITFYSVGDDGDVTPYVTDYTHTNNDSGYIAKTEVDGDVITYSYSNCK